MAKGARRAWRADRPHGGATIFQEGKAAKRDRSPKSRHKALSPSLGMTQMQSTQGRVTLGIPRTGTQCCAQRWCTTPAYLPEVSHGPAVQKLHQVVWFQCTGAPQ